MKKMVNRLKYYSPQPRNMLNKFPTFLFAFNRDPCVNFKNKTLASGAWTVYTISTIKWNYFNTSRCGTNHSQEA